LHHGHAGREQRRELLLCFDPLSGRGDVETLPERGHGRYDGRASDRLVMFCVNHLSIFGGMFNWSSIATDSVISLILSNGNIVK
jgi:hypothetical protein